MEEETRMHRSENRRSELAKAVLFLGGMYCSECPEEVRKRLSKVDGVVEVLVTNDVETSYGIAQVFYSHEVTRDEVISKLGPPYYATLLEDKDPRREQTLLCYTEIYVC